MNPSMSPRFHAACCASITARTSAAGSRLAAQPDRMKTVHSSIDVHRVMRFITPLCCNQKMIRVLRSLPLFLLLLCSPAIGAQTHITTPKEQFGFNIGDDYVLVN